MIHQFDWIPFYTLLANRLLDYQKNREGLLNILSNVFYELGMKNPFLENGAILKDICPFTVFGCFNRGITNQNRIAIAKKLCAALNITEPLPSAFDGIPVLNNMSAWFFMGEKDRKADDIENLWEMFRCAIVYADHPDRTSSKDFVRWFDTVRAQKKVKWNLTMGLYWIRANAYLNLDERNRSYLAQLSQSGLLDIEVPKDVPSGKDYLTMVNICNNAFRQEDMVVHSFAELSLEAWTQTTENIAAPSSQARFIRWFAPLLQSLRELGGSATPQQACDQIIKDMELGKEITEPVHEKTGTGQFRNDVAWARNYLAYEEYIDNMERGHWTLTKKGLTAPMDEAIAGAIVTKWVKINAQKRKDKDKEVREVHYWIYAPENNMDYWKECLDKNVVLIGYDELRNPIEYPTRKIMADKMREVYDDNANPMSRSLILWQFIHEMQIGDIVYAVIGQDKLVGRGIVLSDYRYDETRLSYRNVRVMRWTNSGEWAMPVKTARKSLLDFTTYVEDIKKIEELFSIEDIPPVIPSKQDKIDIYTRDDFLREVYMDGDQYDTLCALLQYKQNIILEGAPGVGKTFVAKRLAYSLMGVKDPNRVQMVQFHQSYGYEDFIVGFRPNDQGGFEIKQGPFYRFCKTAQDDPENDYYFIIDEINRGNLSKIFGELLMLLEKDKRGDKYRLMLLYAGETFFVPENVYIIGMMNTADRSLAMMDYALRRRFSFFRMEPAFGNVGFQEMLEETDNPKYTRLVEAIIKLNQEIIADESLGDGFLIGHSFLCAPEEGVTDEWLKQVVEYELTPLLKEYWFDNRSKVEQESQLLRRALQ